MADAPTNTAAPAAAAPEVASGSVDIRSQMNANSPAKTEAAAVAAPAAAAPAKAAEPVKEPTKAEIRRLKLKLDGQDLDLSEEEVIQLASLSAGAQKRFQEAAMQRKQNEDLVAYLKANPAEAMKKLGLDPRKFSEEFLVDALKKEAESPEAKKIREAEERIKGYEEKEKQQLEARQKWEAEQKALQEKAAADAKQKEIIERYDRVFTEALEKSGCQKNQYTVKRMADLQRINLKKKLDLSADSLAKIVREDVENEVKHHVNDRTGEQLMEFLGADIIKKITKAQIAKLKGAPSNFGGNTSTTPREEAVDPNKPKSWREFTRKGRTARS